MQTWIKYETVNGVELRIRISIHVSRADQSTAKIRRVGLVRAIYRALAWVWANAAQHLAEITGRA